jgi:hypothetical protein
VIKAEIPSSSYASSSMVPLSRITVEEVAYSHNSRKVRGAQEAERVQGGSTGGIRLVRP